MTYTKSTRKRFISWKGMLSALAVTVLGITGALAYGNARTDAASSTANIVIPSCIGSGYTGTGVTIKWANTSTTKVQISEAADFSGFVFNKNVTGSAKSTTGPGGFMFFSDGLALNPGATYYVRTVAGSTNTTVGNFSIPSCNTAPDKPVLSLPACIPANYTGAGITATWTNAAVTSVQISTDSTFASTSYPTIKNISAGTKSTTAPNGFMFFSDAQKLNPGTTYYLRTYNGSYSTPASFTIPVCGISNVTKPSCIPTGYTGNGLTFAWQDTTVQSLQIATEANFSGFYFAKNVTGSAKSTTGPGGFMFFSDGLALNPNTTYYVRTVSPNNTYSPVSSFTLASCNVTPVKPVVSTPACIANPYSGSGITLSWSDPQVTNVQLSGDKTFGTSGANYSAFIFQKQLAAGTASTTAPNGFMFFDSELRLDSNIMYFARVFNGNWSEITGFSVPPCSEPALPATVPTPAANATKVMILGDSITHGDTTHDSYRRPLWHQLTTAGYDVDFVGSHHTNLDLSNGGTYTGLAPSPDFDLDNEGHYGYNANQILANIDLWAGMTHPDYTVIEIGSNDVANGRTPQMAATDIASIVDRLRVANPNMRIILTSVIPSTETVRNNGVVQLNQLIPGIASQKSTAASPVTFADVYAGFSASTDTFDGIHPNTSGENKIATTLFGALQSQLPAPATTTAAKR